MSKETILELKHNDVKRFKASTTGNPSNKIFVDLKITRFSRLLVMSNLFKNKNIRHNLDFNKINFVAETTAYALDGATYIGTVGSTITDVSMDIYYVTEVVKDDTNTNVNIGYFLAFPTLLLIPDVTTKSTRVIELEATVFGIDDGGPIMRSGALEITHLKPVKAYLKNISFTAPNKLGNKLITFPGVDEDSIFNTTEVYYATGQSNGDNIQPNQYIDLGPIASLVTGFNPLVGIELEVAGIRQTTHNAYAYSVSERVNMKSGSLCIPLNF